MKIGAASWCFTHPHYQPPYEEAIKTVGSLGVDGIEMIAYNSDDLYGYYTDERCKELKKLIARRMGMDVEIVMVMGGEHQQQGLAQITVDEALRSNIHMDIEFEDEEEPSEE